MVTAVDTSVLLDVLLNSPSKNGCFSGQQVTGGGGGTICGGDGNRAWRGVGEDWVLKITGCQDPYPGPQAENKSKKTRSGAAPFSLLLRLWSGIAALIRGLTPTAGQVITGVLPLVLGCGVRRFFATEGGRSPAGVAKKRAAPQTRRASGSPANCAAASCYIPPATAR